MSLNLTDVQYAGPFCRALYDNDQQRAVEELVALVRSGVEWPTLLVEMATYATRYRVTDWFSAHWFNALVSAYMLAERLADPVERIFPFIQACWLLSGSGESSLLGFMKLAEGRKALELTVPDPIPLSPDDTFESVNARFLDAFCAGRTREMVGILLGALHGGFTRHQIKEMIVECATVKYAMDGHTVISAVWIFRYLDRVDWKNADLILTSVVPTIRGCWDLLHDFPALPFDNHERVAAWTAYSDKYVETDADRIIDAILYATPEGLVEILARQFDRGVSGYQICHYLSMAMAYRVLRVFRPDERNPDEMFGWGFYLGEQYHILMVVEPLREVLKNNPGPNGIKAVMQQALYINSLKHREKLEPHPDFGPTPLPDDLAEAAPDVLLVRLRQAIDTEKGGLAATLTRTYLSAGHSAQDILDVFLDVQRYGFTPFTAPEHNSHAIYFIQGAVDEYPQLPASLDRAVFLAGCAKIIAMFRTKDHTLHNRVVEVLENQPSTIAV